MSTFTLMLRKQGVLVARILLGGFFLLQGVGMFMGIDATARYIGENSSLPFPLTTAWIGAILETLLGAAIIVGYKVSRASMLLAVIVAIASISFHEPSLWATDPEQKMLFLKNMAIIGGLLYMGAYGPGDGWSLANRKGASA